MATACYEVESIHQPGAGADNTASSPCSFRPCVGAKRGRDLALVEPGVEEGSGAGGSVACGAASPLFESRSERGWEAEPGSGARVPQQASNRAMGTPSAGTEGPLTFEVASLRAAASAAVAECTKIVDGPGFEASGRQSSGRPTGADGLIAPSVARKGSLSPRAGSKTHGGHRRGSSRPTDPRAAAPGAGGAQGKADPGRAGSEASTETLAGAANSQACPPHGAKAICGRRPRMEDAYTAIPFLLEVLVPADVLGQTTDILPPRIATHVRSASTSPTSSEDDQVEAQHQERPTAADTRVDSGMSASTNVSSGTGEAGAAQQKSNYVETLHFFGVFDGHGGAEGALHCAQTLHQRIVEAVMQHTAPAGIEGARVESSTISTAATPSAAMSGETAGEESSGPPVGAAIGMEEAPLLKLQSSSELKLSEGPSHRRKASGPGDLETDSSLSDSDAFMAAAMEEETSSHPGKPEGVACSAEKFEHVLMDAFNRTDEEFGKADNAALVGTTAVVALVGSRQLYVANCGDSRAVLCRGGVAIPLTDDHKAAREDETARVEAAGGQILFWNGVRVMGVLAVSRAIGDHCLRPFVIAQPEVTILGRRPDDELLLLASDGLWDVLSNQEACTLAKRCLRRARQRGASRQSAARIAATVLTRAAVDRGSRDNVTVVVVDLSTGNAEGDALNRAPSAAAAVGTDDGGDEPLSADMMARSRSSQERS